MFCQSRSLNTNAVRHELKWNLRRLALQKGGQLIRELQSARRMGYFNKLCPEWVWLPQSMICKNYFCKVFKADLQKFCPWQSEKSCRLCNYQDSTTRALPCTKNQAKVLVPCPTGLTILALNGMPRSPYFYLAKFYTITCLGGPSFWKSVQE